MNAATATPAAHVANLERRIAAVRRRRAFAKVAMGVALVAAILPGVLAAEAVVDFAADLPWLGRALILLGALGATGFLVWRDAIQPLRRRLHDDAIALMVEHAIPSFRTRFIASLQLAREHGDPHPVLIRALLAETAAIAATANFGGVIKTAKLKRIAKFAAGILVIAAALAWYGGASTPLLLKRALLFNTPLPRKTHIVTVTGDAKVGVGEDLKLDLLATGVLPPSGQIVTTAAGKSHEITLEADPAGHGKYDAVIHAVQEPFTYQIKLNDDTSAIFHVTTMVRPDVAEVACEQTYPAYVHLPPVKRAMGDLTLLAGSQLRISVTATAKISKGWLHLTGLETDAPLAIDAADPTRLSATLPIPPKGLTGFSIHLVDDAGAQSRDGATYRIDLVPDRAPTVQITYPTRREELATSQATLTVAFEAEDDFAVAKAACHYSIDQGPEQTIDFALGLNPGRILKSRFNWKLASLQPRVAAGSTIEFWIVVADNNDVTGPGIGMTDHYRVRIVTDAEKQLDIANRLRDAMEGLGEVEKGEQELNESLGGVIFEKPAK